MCWETTSAGAGPFARHCPTSSKCRTDHLMGQELRLSSARYSQCWKMTWLEPWRGIPNPFDSATASRFDSRGPSIPSLRRLYGRTFFLDRDNSGDLKRAVSDYEQAIKLDSSYALAWVGFVRARFAKPTTALLPLMRPTEGAGSVEQALPLDPNLAEAHSQSPDHRCLTIGIGREPVLPYSALSPRPGKFRIVGFAPAR